MTVDDTSILSVGSSNEDATREPKKSLEQILNSKNIFKLKKL